MAGYVDLHSHWLPGIDDGVRSEAEGIELLKRLRGVGFTQVIATPHMRPAMFDNDAARIREAYARMGALVASTTGLPEVGLASEHYLDDVVFQRLVAGEGVPYPGGHAVLVELHAEVFPARLSTTFFTLRRARLRPVLAHPERYVGVWDKPGILEPLIDGGALMLLDVAALVGKYGRRSQRTAEHLVEEGYYYAACSDAHRPDDAADVAAGIARLRKLAGDEEATYLLSEGPRNILAGTMD